MWSANAGDSRAILATTGDTDTASSQLQLVALTTDHNPDLPTEKARIVAAGGFVSPPPEPGLSARVWLDPQQLPRTTAAITNATANQSTLYTHTEYTHARYS
eukprot:17578-Heterococcus_DN1.PRE.3